MLRASMSLRCSMAIPFLFLEPIHDGCGRLVNRHLSCVYGHFRIHRDLVRVVDSGEACNIAAASLGVESLYVPPLTFLERGRDVDLYKIITQVAHELPRFLVRRDKRCNNDDSVPLEPARKEPDAAHVSIAIGARETRLRENVANRVAIEMLRAIAALL